MKQEYFRMQTRPVLFNIKMFHGWSGVMIRNITVPSLSFLYTCRTSVCPTFLSRPGSCHFRAAFQTGAPA